MTRALPGRRRWSRAAVAAIGLLCLGAGSPAAAQPSGSILGLWRTQTDGGSTVRISTCGDAVCGQIVGSTSLRADPDLRDRRNADPTQRTRRLQGLRILQVRPDGPGRWGDGWVYNPQNGKTYRGSITMAPDGRLRLTGCVVRPLCLTQTWTRVAE